MIAVRRHLIEREFDLAVIAAGVGGVTQHCGDVVAVGLPKLVKQQFEEGNHGVGLIGIPVCWQVGEG